VVDVDDLLRRVDRLEQEQRQVVGALKVSEEERLAAEDARDQYHNLYLEMLERCRKLERGLIGQKAERLPDNEQQFTLSILEVALGHGAAEELKETRTSKRIAVATITVVSRYRSTCPAWRSRSYRWRCKSVDLLSSSSLGRK
jgi:hypothetical protein